MKNIYVVNIYWQDKDQTHEVKRYFTNKKKASVYVVWRKQLLEKTGNPEGKIVFQTKEKVNEYDYLMEG